MTTHQQGEDASDSRELDGRVSVESINRFLVVPQVVRPGVQRGDTWISGRVHHKAIHDVQEALPCHLIGISYSGPHDSLYRSDGKGMLGKGQPNSITVIPKGHFGVWDVPEPGEVSNVFLTDQRLQSCADDMAGGRRVELMPRVAFGDASGARIMEMLGREAATSDVSSSLFVEQAIDLLCIQLVRGHSSFGALAAPGPHRGLADWQVKRVTGYMQEHLDGEISLDDLSALVHLSRFHFCTAFRLATGRTPHEWLVIKRIEKARQLLTEPALRITDIALAVGYGTPSAFTASFRKLVGVTPTEFRRRI